ncbi:hypothetical protein SELMODRAFT_112158 [Selaginella moellendorffii]|uniref:Pentacotripeptide-repeat region of PRORP domain-containing protein n=2 Tax=Selaginella moellendorffii TaxID=88036 RepID=D8S9J1_SELML|nr:hypothetical protein SELMODRAFT_112158 [Selaginella moellendorffii]
MPERDVFSWTGMVAAYTTSGNLDLARRMFDSMPDKDLVAWNSMIAAHCRVGNVDDVLRLYTGLLLAGTVPDEVTFTTVLGASSHAGLLREGLAYFVSMTLDHRIMPLQRHYRCVIDLLGRSGLLLDAEQLLKGLPYNFAADDIAGAAFLGACKTHRDVDRGAQVAREVIDMDAKDDTPYVLLSSIYSGRRAV